MSAPVMQLRAKGPQDFSLVVDPEVTFWKAVYPRHTNFAMSDLEISQSAGQNTWGQTVTFTLPRSGDLVSQLMLYFTVDRVNIVDGGSLAAGAASPFAADGAYGFTEAMFVEDLGRAIIDKVTLTIGGYEIEEMTGDWLHIWDRLSKPAGKSFVESTPAAHGGASRLDFKKNLAKGVPVTVDAQTGLGTVNDLSVAHNTGNGKQHIYVPLSFTMCSAHGLALPMIAIQFHDTKVKVAMRPLQEVSRFTGFSGVPSGIKGDNSTGTLALTGGGIEAKLLARYIYLDDAERAQFVAKDHVYLITETQSNEFTVETAANSQIKTLHFNHPTKALYCYFVADKNRDSTVTTPGKTVVSNFWNWTVDGNTDGFSTVVGHMEHPEAVDTLNLAINQQKIYGEGRDAVYFGNLLMQQFHTRAITALEKDRVYIMPFGLEPESWKPTGELNFSRVDNVQMTLTHGSRTGNLPAGKWVVLARSFNDLKIKNGMGGKRFAS